ncbi:hypothetical protein TPCU411_14660 [Cutibacterium acnes]|nr:hypothetical protein TPCU411_14660 [Cutibacterium acnes]
MLGDFNAYAMEDPIRARKAAGFSEVVEEYDPDAASCEFSGRVGSLDHIFANAKAHELVSGAGIWDTNGSESVAMQYSRRDDIVADLHHQPVRCIGTLASPGGLLYADSGPSPVSTASSTPAVTLVVGSVGPSTAVVAPTSGQGSAFQPRLPRTGV